MNKTLVCSLWLIDSKTIFRDVQILAWYKAKSKF